MRPFPEVKYGGTGAAVLLLPEVKVRRFPEVEYGRAVAAVLLRLLGGKDPVLPPGIMVDVVLALQRCIRSFVGSRRQEVGAEVPTAMLVGRGANNNANPSGVMLCWQPAGVVVQR